ncbi:Ni/Fe hydrogenase subunit alpha [Methanococcus aeolicus]|uniref:Nickel-dependent hydrogenase large subunit n=1 Tax=Methanococcus aeolicus (strain ATCC BAA-1280 / DSM 17508 / OCM 812 / Nankai-3) TaxID=419665 RepID=A6UT67_META3|nr:Ni/Fe hydrogenase subunit alpha [Methanococcus aeolicus]ABR55689.1 nickel-dependent hydrogenase large subunit [Methanococcus aeolicus Nankai-3]UXM85185.1 Ni/Fe hydrogenase subunit alpha [Methanococcus aeolicus]
MVKLSVEPVTRVEGHGKITVSFDESGALDTVHFNVVEVRGFEKFMEGRYVEDAPILTPRICGICQVSHHLASAKAVDEIYGVKIPETAMLLRNLMHQSSTVHSHALHFYALAAPDLMFPTTDDILKRNLMGMAKEHPEVVKEAIELRKIGQTIVRVVGGRAIHPCTAVVGGQSISLSETKRDELLKLSDRAVELSEKSIEIGKKLIENIKNNDLLDIGYFESYHAGMVNDGTHELYDGKIRVCDSKGKTAYEYNPSEYLNYIAEGVKPYSYLKFPYLKDLGEEEGVYRVNTLSRLNVADRMATPLAQKYYKEFIEEYGEPCHYPVLFNYARLIEMLSSAELTKKLLENDKIVDTDIKAEPSGDVVGEGVGCVEAPRGTLFHHFKTDDKGVITDTNLIVATTQNNPAMDIGVKKVAEKYIKTPEDATPNILNYMEMVIRAYDPCLSCATHVIGDSGGSGLILETYEENKLIKSVRN